MAALALGLCVSTSRAEITNDDMTLLGLMFRNVYVPYSERADADPEVKKISEEAGKRNGTPADNTQRYQRLMKGIAIMQYGGWTEAREVVTAMDMRLSAKIAQPGDAVKVRAFPLYERAEPLKGTYTIQVLLQQADMNDVDEAKPVKLEKLEPKEVEIHVPANAPAGRYRVQYSIQPEKDAQAKPFIGIRYLFVVPQLKNRLENLDRKLERLRKPDPAEKNINPESLNLGLETLEWFVAAYRKASQEDLPGAYGGHPIAMVAGLMQNNMTSERLDFPDELTKTEELADDYLAGRDPMKSRKGDMRLAYRSPADGQLVPFRIFVPDNFDAAKNWPLVVALHGAGGDENAFMDGYQGTFKKSAQKHGYLAVSVNGRGPYTMYAGNAGRDPLDALDRIEKVYPIDPKRVYLTGHSMGGFGTVQLGFNNPDRFAALAPIAGYGAATQLAKAKEMPLIIAQGDKDALVPVATARKFHESAQQLGMPSEKYIEKAGVDHLVIPVFVMEDLFDWFDAHKK